MCSGNPLGMDGYGIHGGCQLPPFFFFLFLRPQQYWHEGGPLSAASALVLSLGTFWHTVTLGMSGNMSGISCLYLQSARLTRQ
jgi:hypothetical protein